VLQRRFKRYRTSVVAEPDTLEKVLAEYEEKRKAGDPKFTQL